LFDKKNKFFFPKNGIIPKKKQKLIFGYNLKIAKLLIVRALVVYWVLE
jgi:hypothetical protein